MNGGKYSLIRLPERHLEFLNIYANIVYVGGEKWYHLPNYYREEKDGYFELVPPEKVPDYVKSLEPQLPSPTTKTSDI